MSRHIIAVSVLMCSPLLSAEEPVEKAKPAVVFIQEAKEKGAEERKTAELAVGVIVDCKGTVVTNHSAIKAMKRREVILSDGRRFPVKSLQSDPDLDLAIIKIEDARPLPFVEVGDSDNVKQGDSVIALGVLGTPATNESLVVAAGLIGGRVRGPTDEFLFQVDTPIGPGCSAGPLITKEGRFIGLVVSRDLSPRTSRAVPSNRLREREAQWAEEK